MISPHIGLLGFGSAAWIAGVQYQQSLLHGHSQLSAHEQARFSLLLLDGQHRSADFASLMPYVHSVHTPYFSSQRNWLPLRHARFMLRRAAHQQRWPRWPRETLAATLRQQRIDVLFPANDVVAEPLPVQKVGWITDFQHVHLPQFFPAHEIRRRNATAERIMRHADRVIVSNQFSVEDARRLFPAQAHKLAVLPFTMSLGDDYRQADATAVARRYGLPDKYLFFPSQFWKHKNHQTLFEAVRLLRSRGLTDVAVVCTGYPHDYRFPTHYSELRAFVEHYQLGSAIRLLGLIPRPDQVQLMRRAAALVQPSFFEGWSALLEEGHSLGKRVFAADTPMHREQRTDQTVLFDPHSAEELADYVAQHWPRLLPGPDLAAEAVHQPLYEARLQDFARRFIAICHQTAPTPCRS